jgi:hypothetical protein
MFGEALNADSVFLAEPASSNSSAATLFAPMISASTERFRTRDSRNVARSYATKAAHAVNNAVPLTSKFIRVSFLANE